MNNLELVEKCYHYASLPNHYDNKTTNWMTWNGKSWPGDCIRTPKAIMYWNWKEDKNKPHGGAVYDSRYDFSEQGWINHCKNVSKDFSNIKKGELLMMNGHCGIYLGNGKVFEVSVAWGVNGATISDISNKGYRTKNGVPAQNCWWQYHGMIPEIEYKEDDVDMTYQEKEMLGFYMNKTVLKRGCKGEEVSFLQDYLSWCGCYTGKIDGDFGAMTESAVIAWQKSKGLVADGWIGPKSWEIIRSR